MDRRAVAAVMASERALDGSRSRWTTPTPAMTSKSRDRETGTLYLIEVKGRIEGEDTVTVKVRQIRRATHIPDPLAACIGHRSRG